MFKKKKIRNYFKRSLALVLALAMFLTVSDWSVFFNLNTTNKVKAASVDKNMALMEYDGKTWARVFYHDTRGGLFTSEAEALSCISTYKYSCLGNIQNLKPEGNTKYEFMLYYPEMGKLNRWKQTNRPQDEIVTDGDGTIKVTGYEAITIQMSGNYWGGLAKSTTAATLIDGSVNHENWWYAIGSYSYHPTNTVVTIPGGDSVDLNVVELWMVVDEKVEKESKTFNYTGEVQTYIAPYDGWYKLEAFGASGGGSLAGEGGYTSGLTYLAKGTVLYIYVGEAGQRVTSGYGTKGTFNGGGDGSYTFANKTNNSTLGGHLGGSGGGATDFRIAGGTLIKTGAEEHDSRIDTINGNSIVSNSASGSHNCLTAPTKGLYIQVDIYGKGLEGITINSACGDGATVLKEIKTDTHYMAYVKRNTEGSSLGLGLCYNAAGIQVDKIVTSSLESRVLIAGGGGGGSGCASNHNPGDGGGLIGATTLNPQEGNYPGASASGGSQTSAGASVGTYSGSNYMTNNSGFGIGSDAMQCAAGGGGGYYGGGSEYTAGGGGGSSYVSNYNNCDDTYLNYQQVNNTSLNFGRVILQQGGQTGSGVAVVTYVGMNSQPVANVSSLTVVPREFGTSQIVVNGTATDVDGDDIIGSVTLSGKNYKNEKYTAKTINFEVVNGSFSVVFNNLYPGTYTVDNISIQDSNGKKGVVNYDDGTKSTTIKMPTLSSTESINKTFLLTSDSTLTLTTKNNTTNTKFKNLYSIDSPIIASPNDIQNAINGVDSSWKMVGSGGSWSVNNDGIIINSANQDNISGFISTSGYGYEDLDFSFSATSNNSDNDVLGALFGYTEKDGKVSTYVFYLNGQSASASHPGKVSGLYKIVNGSLTYANLINPTETNTNCLDYDDNQHWNWKSNLNVNAKDCVYEQYNIKKIGNHISIMKNGEEILSYTDDSILNGTYGFFSISQPNVFFKDVSVYTSLNDSLLSGTNENSYNLNIKDLPSGSHKIYVKQENYDSVGYYLGTPGEKVLEFYKNVLPIATIEETKVIASTNGKSNVIISGKITDDVEGGGATNKSLTLDYVLTGNTYDSTNPVSKSATLNVDSDGTFNILINGLTVSNGDYTIKVQPNDGYEEGEWVSTTFKVENKEPSIEEDVIVTINDNKELGNATINFIGKVNDNEKDYQDLSVKYSLVGTDYLGNKVEVLNKLLSSTEFSSKTNINFTHNNLKPGSYNLKVVSNDGFADSNIIDKDFIVRRGALLKTLTISADKNTYAETLLIKNTQEKIYLKGTFDYYNTDLDATIYYKVGVSGIPQVLATISNGNTVERTFEGEINASQFDIGSNEIYVYIQDAEGYISMVTNLTTNKGTENDKKVIVTKNMPPVLSNVETKVTKQGANGLYFVTVSDTINDNYENFTGNTLSLKYTLTGIEYDWSSGTKISNSVSKTGKVQLAASGDKFSFDIKDLKVGTYEITLVPFDEHHEGQPQVATFVITNTNPSLTISSAISSTNTKNFGEGTISVVGTISDYESAYQKLTASYIINGTKYNGEAFSQSGNINSSKDKVTMSNNKDFSFDITGLYPGSYTITITPCDVESNGEAKITSVLTIEVIYSGEISLLNRDIKDSDKNIEVVSATNKTPNTRAKFFYYVDDISNGLVEVDGFYGYDITKNIVIPVQDLEAGDHTIYVIQENYDNNTSSPFKLHTLNAKFVKIHKNTVPELETDSNGKTTIKIGATINKGDTVSNTTYENGIRITDKTKLTIEGNVFDAEGEDVTVKYVIYNSKGVKLTNEIEINTVSIVNGEFTQFNGIIDIPSHNLPAGDYVLKVIPYDGHNDDGLVHTFSISINYKPTLESSSLVVKDARNSDSLVEIDEDDFINKGLDVYLNGLFKDLDGDTVRLLYRFDNETTWKNGVNGIDRWFANGTTNNVSFVSSFITSNNLSEGVHTIYFKIRDHYGDESEVKSITFNVNYHPILKLEEIHISSSEVYANSNLESKYAKVNENEDFWLYGTTTDKDNHSMSIEISFDSENNYQKLVDVDENGFFKAKVSSVGLSQGFHTIYVRVYDEIRGTVYDCNKIEVYNYIDSKCVLTKGLHINAQPELRNAQISSKEEGPFLNPGQNIKISKEGTIYFKGTVFDSEGDNVELSYKLTRGNDVIKEGKLADIIINETIDRENTSIDYNLQLSNKNLGIDKGMYTLTITPKDVSGTIGKSVSYDVYVNTLPTVSDMVLELDNSWGGTLYKGQKETQGAVLKFTVNDLDDLANSAEWIRDSITYTIKIDGKTIYTVDYTIRELVANNGSINVVFDNLQDYLTTIPETYKTTIITVEVIDGYGDKTSTSITEDVHGNSLSIQSNGSPIINSFDLSFDIANTGKYIYNELMVGQTKKPTFTWDIEDPNPGDEIVKIDLYYSVDNTLTWKPIELNMANTITSFEWLNNTSYNKQKVCFKVVATDKFGTKGEATYGVNDYIYLNREYAPNKPNAIYSNNNKTTYFVDKDYLFNWSKASDINEMDAIVEYVFGFIPGDGSNIVDYTSLEELYRGPNLTLTTPFNYQMYIDGNDTNVTFGVYAIDKFGKMSDIKTLTVSFFENHAPNKVAFSIDNFFNKDLTALTEALNSTKSYTIKWTDAGDIDAGDGVESWAILYRDESSEDLNDWKYLGQTKNRTELSFNMSQIASNLLEVEGRLMFKIIAVDKYGLSSEDSNIVYIDYVNDTKAPTLVSSLGKLDGQNQPIKLVVTDESSIDSVSVIFNGKTTLLYKAGEDNSIYNATTSMSGKLYKVTIPSYIVKFNGNYTIKMVDKHGNESSEVITIDTIDVMPPVITITPDKTNSMLTNDAFDINIKVQDNSSVKVVTVNIGGEVKTYPINNSVGTTKITVDKNCTIVVTATDTSGNSSSTTYNVTNIYKATAGIVDDFEDIFCMGSNSFRVTANISNSNYLSLGSWSIVGPDCEYETSTNGTYVDATVYENGTYEFTFTDIWGNVSGPHTIEIKNIISSDIEMNRRYYVPWKDYNELHPELGENFESIVINTNQYAVDLGGDLRFVEIASSDSEDYINVFAYFEIIGKSAYAYSFEDYQNTGVELFYNDLTNKNNGVLFKFTSDKNYINFYYRDITNALYSVKASISGVQATTKPTIEWTVSNVAPTNGNVVLMGTVKDGYFFENKDFYQYADGDVIKNYYDEFKWVSDDSTVNDYTIIDTPNEANRTRFIMILEENHTFKLWAKNEYDDFVSVNVSILNIDKTAPEIVVKDYSTKHSYTGIEVEAYSLDTLFTANELINKLKELNPSKVNEIDNLDISSNYTLSNDKHTATMMFKANTTEETKDLFRFFAKDVVGNIASSEPINIENFYNVYTVFKYSLLNEETGVYEDITKEDLEKIKKNHPIIIKVYTTDNNGVINAGGTFLKENNPSCIIDDNSPFAAIQEISNSGVYEYTVVDKYGNLITDTLNLSNAINRELPILTTNETKNTDGITTQTIDYTITSDRLGKFNVTDSSAKVLYSSTSNELSSSFRVETNGNYFVHFVDEYGNEAWVELTVDCIYGNAYTPEIVISDIDNRATNEDVKVIISSKNGVFTNIQYLDENGTWVDFEKENDGRYKETNDIIILSKVTGFEFTFKNNLNIKVFAENKYGTGQVESLISVSNIDKEKPNMPEIYTTIDYDGYILVNFVDTGDNGFGNKEFNYSITQDGVTFAKDGVVSLNKTLLFNDNATTVNPETKTTYGWKDTTINADGTINNKYTIAVYTTDLAGNNSDVNTFEIYVDNTSVSEFNKLYSDMTLKLVNIKSIKDNETRRSELETFLTEYDDLIVAFEDDIYRYANDEQKAYVQDKINDLRYLMDNSTAPNETVIKLIETYFHRLSQDINDNAFMGDLQELINSLDDISKREMYQAKYDYYKNIIDSLFIDETNTEFNYVDTNGNTVNPLSGYVFKSTGYGKTYGTYTSNGEFIMGEVSNRNYYFLCDGTYIQLDKTGNTYVDGKLNIVNTNDGSINGEKAYYTSKGKIVDYRPADGFYDFEGKWHERLGLEKVETTIDDGSGDNNDTPGGDSGEGGDTPGGETPGGGDDSGDDDNNDNPGGNDPSNPGEGGNTPGSDDEDETPEVIYPIGITLLLDELELNVGDTFFMSHTITPINVTEKAVTWTTTNSSVVKVVNGNIIACGEGTASVVVTTINGLQDNVNITVVKSSSDIIPPGSSESVTPVEPAPEFPTIEDVYPDDDYDIIGDATYTITTIGDTIYADMTMENVAISDFRRIYIDGYSNLIIRDVKTIGSTILENASNASLNLRIGGYDAALIFSNIDNVGNIKGIGLSYSNGVANVSIDGKSNLGNNSQLIISGYDNEVVYYNGNVVASTYDYYLGAFVIQNPKSGSYKVDERPTTIYTELDKYDITGNVVGTLTYANMIELCYNCLQSDSFGEIYSNIEKTSEVYRQASILQMFGILDSNANISNVDYITGFEAYDMIYMTLANKCSIDLNYEPELFDLETITMNDLNNMVKNITEITY